MITICCQQCAGGIMPYRAQSDGLFKCHECGDLLDRRDIDLDGNEVWAVDAEGILGYVTDPAASLAEMAEAIEEYLDSRDSTFGQLASLEKHQTAVIAFLEAKGVGIKTPATYTWTQVQDAMNEGADVVNDSLEFGEPESDAINLAVNAAMTCLERPGSSFKEIAESNFSDTADEIRSWWGWGK